MYTKGKKLLSLLLTLVMVLGLLPAGAISARADTTGVALGQAKYTDVASNTYALDATVSGGYRTFSISVDSGSLALTNTAGTGWSFVNGTESSTAGSSTVDTTKAYISVQLKADNDTAAKEALESIRFTKGDTNQTITVSASTVSADLGARLVYFGGHYYQLSNAGTTYNWREAMEWALNNSNTAFSGYTPGPAAITSYAENQVLVTLRNSNSGASFWLGAVPSGDTSFAVTGNFPNLVVTPPTTKVNVTAGSGAGYVWMSGTDAEGTALPSDTDTEKYWQGDAEPQSGGPVYFGYNGAYWDDLQQGDWATTTPLRYGLTEWVPNTENANITATKTVTGTGDIQLPVTLYATYAKWYTDSTCTTSTTTASGVANTTGTLYLKADAGYYYASTPVVTYQGNNRLEDVTPTGSGIYEVKFTYSSTLTSLTAPTPAAVPLTIDTAAYSGDDGCLTVTGTYTGKENVTETMEYSLDGTTWADIPVTFDTSGAFTAYIYDSDNIIEGGTVYLRDKTTTVIIDSKKFEYNQASTSTLGVGYVTNCDGSMGSVSVSPAPGTVAANTKIIFTAEPKGNYAFEGWYSDPAGTAASKVSSIAVYTATMPARNYTLYAKFVEGYVPTQLVNGSFELPVVSPGVWYTAVPRANMVGWQTTDPTGFEVIHHPDGDSNTMYGQRAQEGDQYVEMNHNYAAVLYQDLATTGGDVIYWSLQHASRSGSTETMTIDIGAPNGTPSGTAPNLMSGYSSVQHSAKSRDWEEEHGVYSVPEDQTTTRFAFTSKSSGSLGNMLDNIVFKTLLGDVKIEIASENSNQANVSYYWDDDTEGAMVMYKITEKGQDNEDLDGTELDGVEASELGAKHYKATIDLSTLAPGETYTVSVYHSDHDEEPVSIDVDKPLPIFTVNENGTATLNDKGASVVPVDGTDDLNGENTGSFSIANYSGEQLAKGFTVTSSDGSNKSVLVYVRKITASLTVNGASNSAKVEALDSTLTANGTTATRYDTWHSGTDAPAVTGALTVSKGDDDVLSAFYTDYVGATNTTAYHSVAMSGNSMSPTLASLTGTAAGAYTIHIALKSKAAMLTDGIVPDGSNSEDTITPATDGTFYDIAGGLKDLIGKPSTDTEATEEEEAAREAFETAFPNVDLTDYDKLTDEGQKEVLKQLAEDLYETGTDKTYGGLGTKLAEEFGKTDSKLEKYAETQYKLENSDPTNGSVSSIVPSGTGVAIGVNLGSDDTAVTPGENGVTVWAVDKDGVETPLTGSFANGVFTTSDGVTIPTGTTALTVTITDENGFVTTTTTALTPATVNAAYADGKTAPAGNFGGDTTVNTNEATLNEEKTSYTKYVPTGVTYAAADANPAGKVTTEPEITLVATPESGAYNDFYVGSEKVTADNVETLLGASASLSGPAANGAYTLIYKASEAAGKSVEARYRNLLGEINATTDATTLAAIMGDDNFATVFNRGLETNDITYTTAKAAFDDVESTSEATVLAMVAAEITEGAEDTGYTVPAFNAALEAASRYVKAMDELKAALHEDARAGYTAGSIAEAQKVYEAVRAAYEAATEGTKTISTEALNALVAKAEKAADQLVPATFSVEISVGDLPTGQVIATATQPQTSAGADQTVFIEANSKGYVFPQYNTAVELTVPQSADYNTKVIVTHEDKTTTEYPVAVPTATVTIPAVKENEKIEITYTRKDVTVTLPEGVTVTDPTEGVSKNEETGATTIKEAAGTDVTLTFKPAEGSSILPGATVTLGSETYSVTANADGSYSVTVPANALNGMGASGITTALATAQTADTGKLDAMITKAEAVIDSEDAYDITNSNNKAYTQTSWEALKTALTEAKALDGDATEAEKSAAADALEKAYNELVPQHAVNIPTGLSVPEQPGVVYDSVAGYFIADGASLKLEADPANLPDGEKIDSVTYAFDLDGDGDDDQTSTAYPVNGVVTIPVVTGDVSISNIATSDKGFAVSEGPLGAATGVSNGTSTYTVTPETGSRLTSVTVDGTKVTFPDAAELNAVLAASQATDDKWTDNGDGTSSLTVTDVNGEDITFTKDADGNITGTLPGLGEVSVTKNDSTVTATVEAPGSNNLAVGTQIVLQGDGSGVTDETIKPAKTTVNADGDPVTTLTGAEIKVLPTTAGKVEIDFGSANSGSHSVSATTTLVTYPVNVTGDAADAGIKVNGEDAATVKHGEPLTITIPAPENTAQEVGLSSTVTGTINGVGVSNKQLNQLANTTGLEGVTVTINADGSATLTIDPVTGATSITGATIYGTAKGSSDAAKQLTANKATIAELATELGELLDAATALKTNPGKLYDETTDEWKNVFEADTGLQAVDTTLKAALVAATVTDAATAEALLTALNTALGGSYTTVPAAIDAIRAVNRDLEAATEAAKKYAPGVITLPDAATTGTGVANDAEAPIAIAPDTGAINPVGGEPLVINNIDMQDGYDPKITIETDKGNKTFVIKPNSGNTGYEAYEVTEDEDGNETVAITATEGVNVAKDTGKFTVTIPNASLTNVLGFGDPDKTLGNITGITVTGAKQGVILPSAAALKTGLQTGSVNAAAGDVSVEVGGTDVANTTTPVIPEDGTATITVPLGTDDYYGKATSSSDDNATIWRKAITGVELEGKFYAVQSDGSLLYTPAEGDPVTLAGVTVSTNDEGTTATITIDADADNFDPDLDYTTLQLVAEPTNSQYNTFKTEFAWLQDVIAAGEASGSDRLSAGNLANAVSRVEKLIAEAAGTIPAPYALTAGNKAYLAGEIAQLDAYKDRLEALYNAQKAEEDIENLYTQVSGIVPLTRPISDADKATLAAMETAIKAQQDAYNGLTDFEKSLVSADAKQQLNALTTALREAQTDGMGDPQKFSGLVADIGKAMNTPTSGAGITTGNADLIDSMLRAAEDLYAGMTPADKAASAVAKNTLDGLKTQLDTWLTERAAAFAEDWLTTDYTGVNDKNAGDEPLTASNRLNSIPNKEGYADRVLLAKEKYDALSAAERAAVDALFAAPTVPELYRETFPNTEGATLIPDEAVAQNFVERYLTVNGSVIREADATNYSKILGAEDAWNALTDAQKALVNDQLPGDKYEQLLADAKVVKASVENDFTRMSDDDIDRLDLTDDEKQALKDARDFINDHLRYDGSVVTESNSDTRSTILAAKSPWDALSDAAKTAVNGALTGTYKGQTYEALYAASATGGGGAAAGDSDPGDPHANGVADWLAVDDHVAFVHGYAGGLFRPGAGITRAEAAQLFYNLLLNKDVAITAGFDDVPAGKWYARAVNTLATLGILEGKAEGRFDPDAPITRAEFVTIAARFAKPAEGEAGFPDVPETHWAGAQIRAAVHYGWIDGYADGSFRPGAAITRAEAVTIVNRMLGRSADEAYIDANLDSLTVFADVSAGFWAYYGILEAANGHDFDRAEDNTETWTGLA